MFLCVGDFRCTKIPYLPECVCVSVSISLSLSLSLSLPPSLSLSLFVCVCAAVLLWELFHCTTPYADTRLDQMAICKQVFFFFFLFPSF